MKINFDRPTIYCSHSVRGDGSKTMEENCQYACRVADKIERVFPEIDLYVPARHDLSLQVLWNAKKISIDDIMYADLEILRACAGWTWIYTGPSKGCEEEMWEANKQELTIFPSSVIYTDLLKANYRVTRRLLDPIVSNAVRRFRNG